MRLPKPPKREPENMSAAIVAKCHANNQLVLIQKKLDDLRTLRCEWTNRLNQCNIAIDKYALEQP